MKIGILSMQRICNYGSYLQAYGLKKIIESLGHEVVFVDYKIEKPLFKSKKEYVKYMADVFKKTLVKGFSKSDKLIEFLPLNYRTIARSHYLFQRKYWPILGLTPKKVYQTKVDTLVIGSDEVFNCLQTNPDVGYSRELFGVNSNARKIITYAASFGNVTYDSIVDSGVLSELTHFVSIYSAVSVRDKNSHDIMSQLLPQKDISENLDPVLMYDFGKRKKKPVHIKDYIVVYAYRGRLSSDEINAIRDFAQAENKKIVSIGGFHSFADKYVQTSPFHVLDYFEYADYVITDTFHGTIFSIINHTKFGVLVRESHGRVYGNSEKLNDLLSRLGLENRVISKLSNLSEIVKSDLDFDAVAETINRERQRTYSYLSNNL